MAGLLSLPHELILKIVHYIQPNETEITVPYYELAQWHFKAMDSNMPSDQKTMLALLRSCRTLHSIVSPMFYRHLFVHRQPYHSPHRFERALDPEPTFSTHVHSASIPCGKSIADLWCAFWLDNIHTLTISELKDHEPLEFEDDAVLKTSPVKHLKLMGCAADEDALRSILSWPASLETLHCDVEQYVWDVHDQTESPGDEWDRKGFVRALEPQRTSLKELTLTRPPLVHEGLGMGLCLDLSGLTALTTLRTLQAFLQGWDDPLNVWKSLPSTLEVLEVFYDDAGYIDFLEGYDASFEGWDGWDRWNGGKWLAEVIGRKAESFPRLSRIAIYSYESIYIDEEDRELEPGPWELPRRLAQQCKAAGVDVTVLIGYIERPEYTPGVFPRGFW